MASVFNKKTENNLVAITGIGMVTPLGISMATTWQGLLEGKSGVRQITKFDARNCLTQIGGELPDEYYEWEREHIPKRLFKQTVRAARVIRLASEEAIKDSGVHSADLDLFRCGVVIGTSGSSVRSPQDQPVHGAKKFKVIREMINALPAWITQEYAFRGPSYTISAACASGAYAIAKGYDLIRMGVADVVVAGGVDTLLTENSILRGNFLQVLTRENTEKAMRPFDLKRSGFVLADGGCCIVMESVRNATARNADVYAYIAGYGTVSEAYNVFMPSPHGKVMAHAMRAAIQNANVSTNKIKLICANGTATVVNDFYETQAIKEVFGNYAYDVYISAHKSMTGHTIGASGAVAVSMGALALHTGKVPPTINYEFPDPDCDLNYVPNAMIEVKEMEAAMTNAFGFGGHNCCIVLIRAD